MTSKKVGQLIILILVIVGLYMLYSFVRGEILSNVTRTDVVTSGLIAHYTFDGKDIDQSTTTAEVRDVVGSYHGDLIETVRGNFGTTSFDAENAHLISNGTVNGDRFGHSVAGVGDVNGDSYEDILVGAYNAEDTGSGRGRVYLFLGPFTGTSSINAENADVIFNGEVDSDNFGYSVSSAGDVDADGYADLLIGAYGAEDTGSGRGRAYLFLGPFTGTTSIDAENADVVFNGAVDNDQFGASVAGVGDTNGDGYSDLVVGAAWAEDTGSNRGRAYLFLGPFTGTTSIDAENADVVFNGAVDSDYFGGSVAGGGDINGDGYNDIAITANRASDTGSFRGRAYIFFGPFTGTTSIDVENADVVFNGTVNDDYFGDDIDIVGDINNDGYDDLVVGAINATDTGSFRGRAYLFVGPFNGTSSVNAENADVIFNGTVDLDGLGSSVAGIGDINLDGYDDLAIGAFAAEDAGSNRGRAYLFLGPFTGTSSVGAESADVIFNGVDDSDNFAISIASAGDTNGDGHEEVLVGASVAEDSGGACTGGANDNCGAAYLFTPFSYGTKEETGKIGQALVLDGTNGYVDVGNVGVELQTISFWMKADDVTDRPIVALNSTAVIELDSQGAVTATGFPGSVVYVNQATTSTTTTKGEWYHVVVTDSLGVSATDLRIGTDDTNYFKGSIDDFRIYNRVLSQDEIRSLYLLGNTMKVNRTRTGYDTTDPLVDGLAAHYSFDGPTISGNTIGDSDPFPYGTFGTTTFHGQESDFVSYGTVDLDLFGQAVSLAGDINGDGYDDVFAGAHYGRGKGYLFFGPLSGTSSINAENADIVFTGASTTDYFGVQVSAGGDVNGDGYDDIVVSAYKEDGVGTDRGSAYLFFGPLSGTTSVYAQNADVIFTGVLDNDLFSAALSYAGDTNADGYDDILIGAPQAEDTGYNRGRSYLFYGPFAGTSTVVANQADVIFNGSTNGDYFGGALSSARDMNNDGYADILIGSMNPANGDTATSGKAYLFYGPFTGTTSINAENADLIFNGENILDYFGASFTPVGDVNGDNNNDLLIGAYKAQEGAEVVGYAYLFYGPFSGTTSIYAQSRDIEFVGTWHTDRFGQMMSYAGDIDANGYDDIVVSAPWASDVGNLRGQTYLFYSPLNGTTSVHAKNADVIFNGEDDNDYFGISVSSGGDINADGYKDILVGARQAEDSGGSCTGGVNDNCGAIYLFTPFASSSNDGTNSGATQTYGKIGQGMEFAASGWIDSNDIGNIKSVSFWIKADDITSRDIVHLTDSVRVEINASSQITGTGWDYPTYYLDTTQDARLIDTDWHHVVITSTTSLVATDFRMGESGSRPATIYDGILDDVRVYNRTLTPDDVRQLYLLGGSLKINTTSKPKSVAVIPDDRLIAHYTFDGSTIQGYNATATDANLNKLGTFGTTSFDVENADLVSFGTANGDWFGDSLAPLGDINGDGYDDILVGARDAEDTGTNRGRAYLFYGPFTGTSSMGAENADVFFNGAADSDNFGIFVASAGDVNADGNPDILIGAPAAQEGANNPGRVYLFYGPFTGTTSIDAENADVTFNGAANADWFGQISSAGDVNADGYDDLIIGAPQASQSGSERGKAYLFLGPFTGTTSVDAENADITFIHDVSDFTWFGRVSSAGDVNADGYADILIAADQATDTGSYRGQVSLFYGPLTGTTTVYAQSADVVFNGEANLDYLGTSIASAGDVNADGYDDIILSGASPAPGEGANKTYLFFGPFTGTTSVHGQTADVIFVGADEQDYFGGKIASAGDVNADGYADIIIGAGFADESGSDRGRSFLFLGPFTGTTSIAESMADVIFNGETNNDLLGLSVAAAGDTNADGYDDIMLSARSAEDSGGACTGGANDDCGAAYLFTPFADSKDATISGATPTYGKIGQAMEFDGGSDTMTIGDLGTVKSISFWMKADDVTTRDVMQITASDEIGIDPSGYMSVSGFSEGTWYVDAINTTRQVGTDWHFVTLVFTWAWPTATDVVLGQGQYGNNFDGDLDDVRFYNYELSSSEINALYKAGGGTGILRQSSYGGS